MNLACSPDESTSEMDTIYELHGTFLASFLLVIFILQFVRRQTSSLPPGPIGLPIIGNLIDMASLRHPQIVSGWIHKYGKVVYLRTFTTSILVINSGEAAFELLDKRGWLYSDRPQQPMACELSGFGRISVLTPLGRLFKAERKLMNSVLNPRAISKWEGIMFEETRETLQHFIINPDSFALHVRRYVTSVIFKTIYGYKIKDEDDPFVRTAEEFMQASGIAITGFWAVDLFPFLRWIPWLKFQRKAKTWRRKIPDWVDTPYAQLKEHMVANPNSFCGSFLYPLDGSTVDQEIKDMVKWISTSLYGAGSDTAAAVLRSFIRIMIRHPDVQDQVAKEIDLVIGRKRLPRFDDRENLPFMECVYKEVLRCGAIIPFAPPHLLVKDDEYEGSLLPKGLLCIANIWAMLHDEKLFQDPFLFLPSRYLIPVDSELEKLMNPETYLFGFGRRRCPGVHFARQMVWIQMVSILACFRLEASRNEHGEKILPGEKVEEGPVRHPLSFPCQIVPRHSGVKELLE